MTTSNDIDKFHRSPMYYRYRKLLYTLSYLARNLSGGYRDSYNNYITSLCHPDYNHVREKLRKELIAKLQLDDADRTSLFQKLLWPPEVMRTNKEIVGIINELFRIVPEDGALWDIAKEQPNLTNGLIEKIISPGTEVNYDDELHVNSSFLIGSKPDRTQKNMDYILRELYLLPNLSVVISHNIDGVIDQDRAILGVCNNLDEDTSLTILVEDLSTALMDSNHGDVINIVLDTDDPPRYNAHYFMTVAGSNSGVIFNLITDGSSMELIKYASNNAAIQVITCHPDSKTLAHNIEYSKDVSTSYISYTGAKSDDMEHLVDSISGLFESDKQLKIADLRNHQSDDAQKIISHLKSSKSHELTLNNMRLLILRK